MVDGSLRDRHLAQPPCVLEQRGHSVFSLGLLGIYTQLDSKTDLERGGSEVQNPHKKAKHSGMYPQTQCWGDRDGESLGFTDQPA